MENFFNWIAKPLPNDEVVIWFNVHNMIYEKIELYGDIFKSLNCVITDTYMGDSNGDSPEENIIITIDGDHKDYLKSFYMDTFYHQTQKNVKDSVPVFLNEIFNMSKPFSKSDLDMITEIYKMMEKNVK